jgi:ADP-heptose:LPS heptosyltransferase
MKRKIRLHQGQSPGDIVVFSRAVFDLATQYPDYDISIDSPCPAVFEANPHVNKPSLKKPDIKPYANNLQDAGYDLSRIATNYESIFNELVCKGELNANKVKDRWYYEKDGLRLFSSKCNAVRDVVEEFDVDYNDIQNSGWSGRHFSTAFYISLEEKLGVPIKQTSLLPMLFLSDTEKSWMNQVEEETGYRGKFWLINSGYKPDVPLKNWGLDNWQKVVDLLSDKIQFVQVGQLTDGHKQDALNGVIDLRGKTDLRQLIRLSYHAQGSVGHVSLLMHLMAAWEKPCVVVAGGREEFRWEQYQNHRYINTIGQLPCANFAGCWNSGRIEKKDGKEENKKCKSMSNGVAKCMAMIKPDQVANEVLLYEENKMPLYAKLIQEQKEIKYKMDILEKKKSKKGLKELKTRFDFLKEMAEKFL